MIYNNFKSLNLPLEEFINTDDERIILENIRRCSRLVGKLFQVNFWYLDLKEKEIKAFVDRNEKLLFEVNTKISKLPERAWFCINPLKMKTHGQCRYYYEGDLLTGITQYINLHKQLKKREDDEDSYSR